MDDHGRRFRSSRGGGTAGSRAQGPDAEGDGDRRRHQPAAVRGGRCRRRRPHHEAVQPDQPGERAEVPADSPGRRPLRVRRGGSLRPVRCRPPHAGHRAHAGLAFPDGSLGLPGRGRQARRSRHAARAHARSHSHRRRALQGQDPRLGRRQRSDRRGRVAAQVAVAGRASATTTSPRRSSSRARPIRTPSCITTTSISRSRRSAPA